MSTETAPEFSRSVPALVTNENKRHYEIEAGSEECEALALRMELVSIKNLSAQISITNSKDKLIDIEGNYRAEITQTCIVSLEPFAARIEESFHRRYTSHKRPRDSSEEIILPEEEDPPEAIEGEFFDLGEIVAEELVLQLPSYPRSEGAGFKDLLYPDAGKNGTSGDTNPFAVLKNMKRDKE